MLDTVLQIGEILRESPEGLKHHRYVKVCPPDTDKEKILRLSIPVKNDFSFSFDNIKEITNQNEFAKLYYLTFKTSDADGLVKYIFGDIYYELNKGAEGGYYRIGNSMNKQKAFQKNSFERGKEDFRWIKSKNPGSIMINFRNSFEKSIEVINNMLRFQNGLRQCMADRVPINRDLLDNETELIKKTIKYNIGQIHNSRNRKKILLDLNISNLELSKILEKEENKLKICGYTSGKIFLHFDLCNRHWWEFNEELELLNLKMLDEFVEDLSDNRGFVLKKYLYKTLSSPEKDVQFPNFKSDSRYRNKVFTNKRSISNLFYAINYSKTALIRVPYSDIKIVVLPKGIHLTSLDYENFISRKIKLPEIETIEENISNSNIQEEIENIDSLFYPFVEKDIDKITQFDFIFSKIGGQSSPDVDLLELSGIEKSLINYLTQRISNIKIKLQDEKKGIINSNKLQPLSIYYSFLNILGDSTKEKKKYQSHLYKVLPLIYSGTYYHDAALLPALIEKAEFKIREGDSNFIFLKYDFYFLTEIQNTNTEGENLMSIIESQSYKLGLLLGKLAQNFGGKNSPIKSFEKSYVGNLSRRIANLSDLEKFSNLINEKIIIHEKNYENNRNTFLKLVDKIKNFNERYDKNECAFGFFESYFATFKLSDEGNETVYPESTQEKN